MAMESVESNWRKACGSGMASTGTRVKEARKALLGVWAAERLLAIDEILRV
jgi:hypothetical protein